jgi:TRAP-type C4-dicarboxylate transport system permease large subunit
VRDGIADLYATLRRQKLGYAFVVALVVFLLAMVFSFLAFSPVLSPFVYPLF